MSQVRPLHRPPSLRAPFLGLWQHFARGCITANLIGGLWRDDIDTPAREHSSPHVRRRYARQRHRAEGDDNPGDGLALLLMAQAVKQRTTCKMHKRLVCLRTP